MAAALSVPAQAAETAVPGSLNYVEGQVSLNGSRLNSKSVGSVEVGPSQVLKTARGKAEILLTPGIFLRLGENSSMRMLSPELRNTQLEIRRGRALLEVAEISKNNHLIVRDHGVAAYIEKNGIYMFDADQPTVQVFDGRAIVTVNDAKVELKKGKQLSVIGPLQAVKFDRKAAEKQDPLYQWSSLRSEYTERASLNSSRNVGSQWYGPGWYWDPYWSTYSYLPGTGMMLYSPFGYNFYRPLGFYAPTYRYGYRYPRVYGGYARWLGRGSVIYLGRSLRRR